MRDDWDDEYDRRDLRPRRNDQRDDEPRRGDQWGDERDDFDDGPVRPAADRVRAPGLALLIVGVVGILLTIGTLAVILIVVLNNRPPPRELMLNVGVGSVIGVLSIVYFAVMAAGGQRMRQCRTYGLAMTAAILALASIALLGLCSFPIIPFGIWALVVLTNQDVRREFNRQRSGDPAPDPYD